MIGEKTYTKKDLSYFPFNKQYYYINHYLLQACDMLGGLAKYLQMQSHWVVKQFIRVWTLLFYYIEGETKS